MAGLKDIKGYEEKVINICPQDTEGEIIEIAGLAIQLPKVPAHKDILYHDKPKEEQRWVRQEMPTELSRIGSMDEWYDMPKEFKAKYEPILNVSLIAVTMVYGSTTMVRLHTLLGRTI
jgi:hypothetical protein